MTKRRYLHAGCKPKVKAAVKVRNRQQAEVYHQFLADLEANMSEAIARKLVDAEAKMARKNNE